MTTMFSVYFKPTVMQIYLVKNDLYDRKWMYNPHAGVSYCFKLYLLNYTY